MTLAFVLVVLLAMVSFVLGFIYGGARGLHLGKRMTAAMIEDGLLAVTEKGKKVKADHDAKTKNVSA